MGRRASKAHRVRHKKWTGRMLAIFKHCCAYCGCRLHDWTVDHFIPLVLGGGNRLENLLPTCRKCNSDKNGEDPFRWMRRTGVNTIRFGELRDAWCTLIYETFTFSKIAVDP